MKLIDQIVNIGDKIMTAFIRAYSIMWAVIITLAVGYILVYSVYCFIDWFVSSIRN